MPSTERNLSNLTISESFYRLMQTDPVDDRTLIDGTGSLVTYLVVSGTVDAFAFKGNGSQLTNLPISIPSGTVSSSAQTIANLQGTNIVSGSGQRSVLGLGTSDSPTFAGLNVNGTLIAKEFYTQYVSSSIIFQSGSTKFGDTLDDTHQFTGSVLVTGSVTATSFVGDGSRLTGIVNGLPAGLISGSQQISNFGFVSSSQWNDILNKPAGLVSSSAQTISNLSGSNIVSSSGQRSVLGLGESDSPRFASIYATNGNFDGNLVVGGTLTAQTYVVSSSIVNIQTVDVSGSTIFGDTSNDTHRFTGSVLINGAASSSLGFYGNLTGTSSVASLASTSSYIDPLFISASVAFYGFAGSTNVQWGNILFKPANIISSSGQRPVLGLGENDSPRFGNVYSTNGNFDGNVVVGGTLTARTYIISSSVVSYETLNVSGSTKFGNSADDTHQFTGSIYTDGIILSTNEFNYGPPNLSGSTDRLTLWDNISNPSAYNYAIGIESQHLWNSVDVNNEDWGFKWYAGGIEIAQLDGVGNLFLSRSVSASQMTATGFTGSLQGTSSYALTASYALNASVNTGSFATTGSNTFFGNQTISGSIGVTGSFGLVGSASISGDLTVGGKITAQEFYTELISSSILYESGSTKFGNTLDDTHQFTGSLYVTGALVIPTVQTLAPTADVGSIVINSNNLYIYF